MTTTEFGSGIQAVEMPTVTSDVTPAPMPVVESPSEVSPVPMPTVELPAGFNLMDIVEAVKAGVRHEMDAAVADIERRLSQAREMEQAVFSGVPRQTVHAEDLNIGKHLIDGYTLTANSPTNGSIAWSALHVVLLGVDYTITDGNTANKYAWFIKPASGTTATLTTGNSLPTLGPNDALIFINNVVGGMSTPISVLESSVVYAVGPGAIGNAQLDTTTQTLLTTLQQNDIAQQSALDGAITSYFQANAPWPDGSPSPSGGNVNQGDIWYDSDNGWTYRWTGTGGTPANTWFRIADTDISALSGKIDTKVTTYLSATTPTAPAGGFTTGDMWMDTANGNLLKRWSGPSGSPANTWVSVQLGDAAISAVGGAKIGTGINATNVTTGTLTGTLVGTGINGSNVTTGTVGGARIGTGVAPTVLTGAGTAPLTAIPTLTPAKLNTAFHMLY